VKQKVHYAEVSVMQVTAIFLEISQGGCDYCFVIETGLEECHFLGCDAMWLF
jgi:hypothetical protein